MLIEKKYIVLPVNNSAPIVKAELTDMQDGKTLYSLDVKYDAEAPKYSAYIDVSRFRGQECAISAGGNAIEPETADEMPDDTYREPYRPQVHFTAKRGWTNDPNGFIYANGRYHLFYQHNPAGTEWGNMHWGHAVSLDLLHWEDRGDALFPDSLGPVFSGSAICDERNVSGLGAGAILLYYTAAGEPFTQCLAYSTDNGETFTKYAGNPIIPSLYHDNRDPKVIWCDELNRYILALYLDDHDARNDYMLFASEDLLHWEQLQRLTLPGDAECPDIFPLLLDGKPDCRRWVFSGAYDCYLTGIFKDGKFVPDGEVKRLFGFDRQSYAAQTCSGLPDYRRVRTAWNTTWQNFTDSVFSMSMVMPFELTLKTVENVPSLFADPIPELESLNTSGKAEAYLIEGVLNASEHARLKAFGLELELPFTGEAAFKLIIDNNGWELFNLTTGHYYLGSGCPDYSGDEAISAENALLYGVRLHRLASIWN